MKKSNYSRKEEASCKEAVEQLEGLHKLNEEFVENMACVFNLKI